MKERSNFEYDNLNPKIFQISCCIIGYDKAKMCPSFLLSGGHQNMIKRFNHHNVVGYNL